MKNEKIEENKHLDRNHSLDLPVLTETILITILPNPYHPSLVYLYHKVLNH